MIPLAKPVIGAREERAVLEVLRSGQLSLGPRVPRSSRRFAARLGAAHASAVSSGTAGLHLALRAVGVSATATRSSRRRSRSSPAPTRSSTSARGRCSPTSTRCTLNLDPDAAARRA